MCPAKCKTCQSGSAGWEAGLLGVLTFVSRIPFRSRILYHWDSVNFANGMRQFDVLQEHPQPPGYIVYIWLCRLVDLVLQDANATMVWISIVASSLAVVGLYLLGRTMWNRRVGLAAALFLACSPLFWFYGEIALPHTLDTLLVLLAVWLLHRVWRGEQRLIWSAVVVLGIAGGVRQQTLVFLLPLTVSVVWRTGWKRVILSGLLGAGVCLIWFLPLMASCGGVGGYLEKMATFSTRFQQGTSVLTGAGWPGVAYNLRKLGLYTAYGLGTASISLGFYGLARLFHRRRQRRWDSAVFLGLWMAPALLFYSLIHMGQQGLVLVFLPALLLMGAVGLDRLFEAQRGWMVTATLLVVAQAAVFCLVPEYPLGRGSQRLLTRETVVNSDRYYIDRLAIIRDRFLPEKSLVLAANWDHVEYYLPEYTVLPFNIVGKWDRGKGFPGGGASEIIVVPAELQIEPDRLGQTVVIIFDSTLVAYNGSPSLTYALPLESGDTMQYLVLEGDQVLRLGADFFGVLEPVYRWRTGSDY